MLRLLLKVILIFGLWSASEAYGQPQYLVIGVIHSKQAGDSVALLKDKTSGKTFAARVGQAFENGRARIVAIAARTIDLRIDDKLLTLRIGGDSGSFPATSSSLAAKTRHEGIEISGSTVEISASYRDHIVKNELAKVLMQAAAIPHFRDSQLSGFKLWDIEPGSVYEQVGFKNGDIVTAINGQPLIDVGSTIRLLHVLKQEASADVTLDRNGTEQQLNIRIK